MRHDDFYEKKHRRALKFLAFIIIKSVSYFLTAG